MIHESISNYQKRIYLYHKLQWNIHSFSWIDNSLLSLQSICYDNVTMKYITYFMGILQYGNLYNYISL